MVSCAIIYFEMFMKDLETLGKKHELLRPWTSVALKWAYKYYRRMDDNDVYVVTMCECLNITPATNSLTLTQPTVLNPTIRYSWIEKHWEGEYPAMAKKMILNAVSTVSSHRT